MLSNNVFYHETIRKLTAAFGTVFNDISIRRFDGAGTRLKTIKVPFAYGPREKWLARIEQDSSISNTQKTQIVLPRIGFTLNSVTYDPSRQLNPLNKFRKLNEGGNTLAYQYEKVPYIFEYTVGIYVKNTDDGLQILEQILPYFSPQYNLTIVDNPDLSQKTDVPITISSVGNEDQYEGDFSTRRVLIWTLNFTMKAFLYRPTHTQGRIKTVIIDYYTGLNTDPNGVRREERYEVRPDPITAEATDDYGFAETRTFFDEPSLRGADGNPEYDVSSSSSSSTAELTSSSSSNSSSSSTAGETTSSSSSSSSSSSKSSNSSSSSSSSTEVSTTSSDSSSSSSSSTAERTTSSSNSSSSSSALETTSSSSSTEDSETSSSEDRTTSSSSSSSSSSSGDLNM